ncbi:MAG: hypothetical protein WBN68_12265 [Sedimenticolaceae bacterium]
MTPWFRRDAGEIFRLGSMVLFLGGFLAASGAAVLPKTPFQISKLAQKWGYFGRLFSGRVYSSVVTYVAVAGTE